MISPRDSIKQQFQTQSNVGLCQEKQQLKADINGCTTNQQPQKIQPKFEEKTNLKQNKFILEQMIEEQSNGEKHELKGYEWIQSTNEEDFQVMKNICYLEQFLDMYDDLEERDYLHLDIPQFMHYLDNSQSESDSILSDEEEIDDQFEDDLQMQNININGFSEVRMSNPGITEEQGVMKADEFQKAENISECMSVEGAVKNNKNLLNVKPKGKNQMSQMSIDSQNDDDIYSQINQKGKTKRYQSSLALLAQEQFIRISKYGDIALTSNIARKNPKSDDFYDQEDSFIDDDQVDTELKQLAICEADYDDFFMVEGGLQELVKSSEFRERLKDIQEYRDTKKIENHLKTDKKEKQPNPKAKINAEQSKNANLNDKKQQGLNLLADADDEDDDKQVKRRKRNQGKNKKQFDLLHLKQPTFREEIVEDSQNTKVMPVKQQLNEKITKNQRRQNQKSTKNSTELFQSNNTEQDTKNQGQLNMKMENEDSDKLQQKSGQVIQNSEEQKKQNTQDVSNKRTRKSSNPKPENQQKSDVTQSQQNKKKNSRQTQKPEQLVNQEKKEEKMIIIIDDDDDQESQQKQRNSQNFENESTPNKLQFSVQKNMPTIQINVSSSKKYNENSNNFTQSLNNIKIVKNNTQLKEIIPLMKENQVKTRSLKNDSKSVSQQDEEILGNNIPLSKNDRPKKSNKRDNNKSLGNQDNSIQSLQDMQITKKRSTSSINDKQVKTIKPNDETSKRSLSLVNNKVFLEEQPLDFKSKIDEQASQKLKRKIVNPKKKDQNDRSENRQSINSATDNNLNDSKIDKPQQNVQEIKLKPQRGNRSKKDKETSQEAEIMVIQKNITKNDKRKREKDIPEEANIIASKGDKRIKE